MVYRKTSPQNSLHSLSIIATLFNIFWITPPQSCKCNTGQTSKNTTKGYCYNNFLCKEQTSFFISQFYMTNKMGETSAPYYRIYISSIVLIQSPDPPRHWFSLSSSVKVSPTTTNSYLLRLFPNQQKMRRMPLMAIYFSSSSFVAHCNHDIFYLTPSTMLLC